MQQGENDGRRWLCLRENKTWRQGDWEIGEKCFTLFNMTKK